MKDVNIVPLDGSVDAWQQAIYAFLAEKERPSGSRLMARTAAV